MLINQQDLDGSRLETGPRPRGRPPRPRCVASLPPVALFAPAGIPLRLLQRVTVGVDELEAMRLVDAQGLSQAGAARIMGVSRQTVGRLLGTGRRTTVRALAEGLAIDIGGGAFCLGPAAGVTCPRGHARPGRGRGRCCQRTERETHTDD